MYTIAFYTPLLEQPFFSRTPTSYPHHCLLYLHISKVYHIYTLSHALKFMFKRNWIALYFYLIPATKTNTSKTNYTEPNRKKTGRLCPSPSLLPLYHTHLYHDYFVILKTMCIFAHTERIGKRYEPSYKKQEQRCPNATNTWPWPCSTHSLET